MARGRSLGRARSGRPSEEPAVGEWPGDDPAEGSLPASELRALSRVLARHTAGALVAAFWEGSGWEGGMQVVAWWSDDPDATPPPPSRAPDALAPAVLRGPKLELPHRAYVLFRAAPSDLEALADGRAAADVDPFAPGFRTPNLLWPDDCSWCLATEVDLDSTVVGGTRALVDDLLAAPDLEVWRWPRPTRWAGSTTRSTCPDQAPNRRRWSSRDLVVEAGHGTLDERRPARRR